MECNSSSQISSGRDTRFHRRHRRTEWMTHLEVHFAELVGPANQECEADVEMEL